MDTREDHEGTKGPVQEDQRGMRRRKGKRRKHANDKWMESDRAVLGAEVGLSRWMPHEWKHIVSKAVSASCRVMITTTVAWGAADGDS